jgi:hypothetical protein
MVELLPCRARIREVERFFFLISAIFLLCLEFVYFIDLIQRYVAARANSRY